MSTPATYRNALPMGAMLLEYRLESVLGAGGFGMTYLCTDTNLDKRVAIKEYFPSDLALREPDGGVVAINTQSDQGYQWGLARFIQEARTLAKFSHPHIVRVNRYFEANATGYMVMDYEDGESLHQLLKREPLPGEARLKEIVVPLLEGLQAVHETGFLHRDIKPSNIFIRVNRSPVLLDFGSARQAVSGATKSLTAVLTPGYAPLEQYSGDGNQGPWSDIYAMAGVLYRAFTSENPPDAVSRLKNDMVPAKLAQLKGRVSESALRAVQWALALDEKQRPASVEIWKRALEGKASVPAATRSVLAPVADQNAVTRVGVGTAKQLQVQRKAIARPRYEEAEPTSGWRWVGLGAVALAVIFGGRAWYNQREMREAAKLEAARAEIESRLEAQRQAEQRMLKERETQLALKEQSAAEREEAARRAVERDEVFKRLDEERNRGGASTATAASTAAAGAPADTRKPSAAEELRRAPPADETRDRPTSPAWTAPPILRQTVREEGQPPDRGGGDGFAQKLQQDFRHMDTNGDGFLTPDELRGRGLNGRDFPRLDTNGDGRLSLQEFMGLKFFKPEPDPRFKR